MHVRHALTHLGSQVTSDEIVQEAVAVALFIVRMTVVDAVGPFRVPTAAKMVNSQKVATIVPSATGKIRFRVRGFISPRLCLRLRVPGIQATAHLGQDVTAACATNP